jgi:hypothetical protein
MKTTIILLLALLSSSMVNAQFLGGFFSQKNENRKRLAEQIAALQVYKEYLQKGYNIANTGLKTINNIKNGDLGLHQNFFNALKHVNPSLKKYSKVSDLIDLNIQALSHIKRIRSMLRGNEFTQNDNQYINQVLQNILKAIAETLDELITIISDNQLELKDDERINRIDQLYIQMMDQYSFIRSFGDDVGSQKRQYRYEMQQIKQSTLLNDVN